MTILEYIKNLNRIKGLAVDRFGSLTQVERLVFESSYDWLIDHLEISRGTVTVNEELTETMNNFLRFVVDTVNSNQYFNSKLSSFVTDLDKLQENSKKFHATTNNFNIETLGVTTVQKAVVNEALEQYTGNGLNKGFAVPLRDSIYRNILLGGRIKDVKQTLQTYILSGQDETGKLQQYLHNTAIQAVDTYTGAINQQIAQDFVFTGYIISGSIIATSAIQCITAIAKAKAKNGYLTFKEWEEILTIARLNKKAKLIEGTTIKTLPLNKLHWGCRHDFTPVIIK